MALNILTWNDDDVSTAVNSLWTTEASDQVQNLLRMWGYDSLVQVKEDGVFIDVSSLTRQRFMSYVDSVFTNNYYFEWLDYALFSQLIFNPSDIKWNPNYTGYQIKMCDKIAFLSPERAKKYHKPMIFGKNKDQAEYTFSPLYDEVLDENGKTIEVRILLNRDEFIAKMWLYGIRYGLQIPAIEEALIAPKEKKVLIAEALPSTPWQDAYLQTLVALWQDLQIQSTNGKLDWKNYARVFPQVPAWKKMYQKIPLQDGKIGMNIAWDQLLPTEPEDFSMYKLCWEGTSLIQESDIEYIVSSQAGYVQPVIGHYDSKTCGEKEGKKVKVSIAQIQWPVAVTREIQLGTIGPKTGNIDATGDVSIQWEIIHDYWVKAENLKCIGDVNGSIYVQNNANIAGNIIWSSGKQYIKFWEFSQNGQVVSQKWNINIQGKVLSNAILQAQHGNITAMWVESSIVIGKNIQLQSLRSSIVIWEDIQIENVTNSIIICTHKVSIHSLVSLKESGNIIFIIKPKEYKTESEKIWNQIHSLTESSQKISWLIESFEQKNLQIKEDPMIREIMRIKRKQAEKQPISPEEQKKLQDGLTWYVSKIKDFQSNSEELKKLKEAFHRHSDALVKLSTSFQKLVELQKIVTEPEVNIALSQSQTKLAYLVVENFEDFSQLSQETLNQLSHYRDMIQNKTFPIQMIQEIQEGGNIVWKYES